MRRFKSLHRVVLLPLVLCRGSSWVLVLVFHFLSFSWVLRHLASFLFVLAEFPVFLDHCIPPCRSYQNFMGASAAMDRKSYIPLVHRFDSAIIPNLPSRSAVGPHG